MRGKDGTTHFNKKSKTLESINAKILSHLVFHKQFRIKQFMLHTNDLNMSKDVSLMSLGKSHIMWTKCENV